MITIEYGRGKKLCGLTKEQLSKVKHDLTFKNPAYEQVMRFSKWDNTRVPPYLYYYKAKGNCITVPQGYMIDEPVEVVKDERISLEVEYPKFKLELREIQQKAVGKFKDTGTLVLPTGTGKSICGLYLAGALKQRALIVVNKDDLVDGWMQDAKLCYGDLEIGLVKGKSFKIGKQITLTTIQTLSRLGDKKLEQLYANISMLIVDECHRAGSKSYQVLNSFPVRFRLGLTATKMRNDGLVDVVDLICGKTRYDGSTEETDAIIPPENIHIIRKSSGIYWYPQKSYYNSKNKRDIHNFSLDGYEYVEGTDDWKEAVEKLEAKGEITAYPLRLHGAYNAIATNESFNMQVCNDIKREYTLGHSCIVFCKTVEHLNLLYDSLINSCPKIQKFYGEMKETKAEIKQRAESKEVLITLATLAIATEGTNVKSWEVAFLVGDIGNEKDLIQALGRIRRTKEGKECCWVYDYRHPRMIAIRNHGNLRDKVYKSLGIRT